MAPETLTVRVVYALPDRQWGTTVTLMPGATAMQAVEVSGVLESCPEIGKRPLALAVFGRPVQPGTPLKPNDRVEILRPLLKDPKDARRQRAGESRAGRTR